MSAFVLVSTAVNGSCRTKFKHESECCNFDKLDIKACGLGSRIQDMEADMVNIFDLHRGC